jgi:hypothetical protein
MSPMLPDEELRATLAGQPVTETTKEPLRVGCGACHGRGWLVHWTGHTYACPDCKRLVADTIPNGSVSLPQGLGKP